MIDQIAIVGYGKMGKMIHSLAESMECNVSSIIDPHQDVQFDAITEESVRGADVCLDFSHPSAVLENVRQLAKLGKSMVIGTTGWNEHHSEVRALAEEYKIGIVFGANFSIGMNLFTRIVEQAAALFDPFAAYDVFGYELHHNQKADSPSGTAIQLARAIISHSSRKNKAVYEKLDRRIEEDELHFASVRGGRIPGTHTVGFDSEADTVELVHRVRNRSCFALGALQAAKWISGRKGFYSFNQMMEDILADSLH
ncbi:MAG: 4-hydroxy-tetrahydrodipicolinate reductase [Candidatus Cloacimonadaceae bacterium]|nr:4-hydroxy-tetrahydrodipicolinate reductase [Candidatus Cloacimonadaceae bacterium]